eukprot:2854444-Amphidinium_carterae.1
MQAGDEGEEKGGSQMPCFAGFWGHQSEGRFPSDLSDLHLKGHFRLISQMPCFAVFWASDLSDV